MSFAVLLSTQRSGTNLLRSILDSHPHVDAHLAEIFHSDHANDPFLFFSFLLREVESDPAMALPGNRALLFSKYLRFLDLQLPKERKILDVKYNSIHHLDGWWKGTDGLLQVCRRLDIPVIHLIRRNTIRTAISEIVADEHGVYVVPGDAERPSLPRVQVDPARLFERFGRIQDDIDAHRKRYGRLARYVEVYYEEILDAQGKLASEKVVADLAALLEVEPIFDREPKTKRILSGGLEEIVANFDEVSAALRKRSITWA